MIIQLASNWRISVGNMNFELQEQTEITTGDNKGKTHWVRRGYYSGMDSALKAIPDHLALSSSVDTYEEYLAAWGALRKEISGRMIK